MEDLKTLPFAAVWNMLCLRHGAPAGMAWLNEIEAYEREVLSRRV
jgi:L-rhamnose isomerase